MPSKLDKIPLNNEKLDRRVRLTEAQKKSIVSEYELGTISITSLGKKYNVSKRTIQFILFPERKEKVANRHKELRKDGRYYDKEKHRASIQKLRVYKKELAKQGLLEESHGD